MRVSASSPDTWNPAEAQVVGGHHQPGRHHRPQLGHQAAKVALGRRRHRHGVDQPVAAPAHPAALQHLPVQAARGRGVQIAQLQQVQVVLAGPGRAAERTGRRRRSSAAPCTARMPQTVRAAARRCQGRPMTSSTVMGPRSTARALATLGQPAANALALTGTGASSRFQARCCWSSSWCSCSARLALPSAWSCSWRSASSGSWDCATCCAPAARTRRVGLVITAADDARRVWRRCSAVAATRASWRPWG